MSGTPELPPRPQPSRRWTEPLHAWVAWFGFGRLVLSAVCVISVVGGVAWLVRAPAASTEAGLPFTAGAVSSPPVASVTSPTLPPPVTSGSVPPAVSLPMLVHVAGAVSAPGVYELDAGSRVHDAIEMAGGPTADGDLDGLNLAVFLSDGQRVYVPIAGEVDPATVPAGGPPGDRSSGSDASGALVGPATPIDLNTASVEQLQTLPGVGPATATAIVDDRDRHGPFSSVADLERVAGIGPAKLAAVADLVTV